MSELDGIAAPYDLEKARSLLWMAESDAKDIEDPSARVFARAEIADKWAHLYAVIEGVKQAKMALDAHLRGGEGRD